jgi:hypothetical protein
MKTALFKSSHQIPESILTGWIGGNLILNHKKPVISYHRRCRISTCQSNIITVIIYITLLVILCESCAFTWIGRAVGGDIGKPQFNDYSDTRIIKVSPERINYGGRNHVEVHKTDSSVIIGIFKSFTTVPSEKNNQDNNLPADDSVSRIANLNLPGELLLANISNNSGFSIEDSIQGYYPYKIGFKNRNSSYVLSPDKVTNLYISNATENELEKSGNFMESNKIPHRNGVIILDDKHQKLIIPLGEIAYARCQRCERNGKLIGATVGVLIDAAIVMVKTRDEFDNISTTLDF